MAVLADLCELPLRQVPGCNGHFNDCYQADVSFRFWPNSVVLYSCKYANETHNTKSVKA